ncbi:ribonuclease T2-like [Thoreauomyces humboldtii]|nr:ribonuclease T2-like [Thoreauomyces humboldtii]
MFARSAFLLGSLMLASVSAKALPFNPRDAAADGTCDVTAVACSNAASTSNSCCLPTNGHIVLSQQWLTGYCATKSCQLDTVPTTWTLHGAWPDTCAGVNKENCGDDSTQYTDIATQVQNIDANLYQEMIDIWVSYTGDNEKFWEHEWNTHGSCWSPASQSCFSNFQTGQDLQTYFSWVISLRNQFEMGAAFDAAGITTGSSYTADQIRSAITATYPGLNVALRCTGGYLSEVYSAVYATSTGGQAGAPMSDSDSCDADSINF